MPRQPGQTQRSEAGPEAQEQSTGLRRSQRLVNFSHTRRIRTYEDWHPPARYIDMFKDPPLPESPSQPSILTKEENSPLTRKYVLGETAQRANSLPETNVSFEETSVSTLTTNSEEVQSTPTLTNTQAKDRGANLVSVNSVSSQDVISSQQTAPISSEMINSLHEDDFDREEKEKQYRLQRMEQRQEKAKKKAEIEQRKLKLEFERKQREHELELERKQREHEEQMRQVEERLQLRLP